MTRLTPHALVYDLQSAGDPQLSPDGSKLVYAIGRADADADRGTSQIWLADRDGSNARRLTWTGDRNREARWAPDGSMVAFVSDRNRHQFSLCVLPVGGPGEARVLTQHRVGVGGLAWSPDGRSIAYTAAFDPENPDEKPRPEGHAPPPRVVRRLDYKQDNRGFVGEVRNQVFIVDVASGDRRRLTTNANDLLYPAWSPDGRRLVAREAFNSVYARLALIDTTSGAIERIGWDRGVIGVWSWSPGGDRIIFSGDEQPSGAEELFIYDVARRAITRLSTDLECLPDAGFPTVVPPSQPVWLDDDEVLLNAIRAGESGIYRFNVATRELTRETDGKSLNGGLSVDRSGRFVAQNLASFSSVGEVVVFDRQTREQRVITHENETFFQSPLSQWETFQIERDGVCIDAWLLKPPDFDPSKKYPLVLDVHGGPNGFYGYGFNAFQQLLASNGFVVVFSNPRGSGSYGGEFARMVWTDWGGADYFDLMAVVDRAHELPFIDSDRTGIWGYSYGGYMTAWTIGHTNRFKAAVCGAPVFDLESMYGTSDLAHAWGHIQWGGNPHEASEAFAAHSASTFVHRATTPTLIMQGEADERCPIGQGEQMYVALKQAGCEAEFVRYPGGPHAMLRVGPPSHREDFLTRVLDWFTRHLI